VTYDPSGARVAFGIDLPDGGIGEQHRLDDHRIWAIDLSIW
jgi:hypothetical protein